MSNLNKHPVRRAAVGVLAGTLAFSGAALGVGVSSANALEGFDFDRLAGDNRYGTAADIALETFGTADTVIVASGAERNFPDALTGNYLAGEIDGPILLTRPDDLPEETIQALEDLNAQNVIIVGEDEAVSNSVERELSDDYNVDRIGGQNRYETAEEIVRAVVGDDADTSDSVGEIDGQRTAILGNGQDFPDILAAGPLSFGERFPILITPNTSSDLDEGAASLLRDLDIERVLIVGGTDAVRQGAEDDAEDIVGEGNVERLDGDNRFETAVEIADFAYDELGFDVSHVNLARSDDFADALTGGPHGGVDRSPIVVTRPNELVEVVRDFFERRACTLTDGHIFGGIFAISTDVAEAAEDAAQNTENCPDAPVEPLDDTIEVEPDTAATATVTMNMERNDDPNRDSASNVDGSSVDNRTFTVDGLFEGQTYRITLVKCENVRTGSDGEPTFLAEAAAGSSTGFAAVTGNPTADITTVNGEETTNATTTAGIFQVQSTTFVATGSSANFTIDGDGVECVVPVVYFDSSTADSREGGNIPRLEVEGPAGGFGSAVEDVDVGGRTNFVAATQPPAQDTDPATATVAIAMDAQGNDILTVTFDEPVQGVGTFLLRDENGDIVAEFGVIDGQGTRTLTLMVNDGSTVDFAAGDGATFTLEILNERDLAGNQTVVEVPVDETGTEDETPPADTTPATATVAIAMDAAGSDTLTVTFDEAVNGDTGTFLLRDADTGALLAELVVDSQRDEGRTLVLVASGEDVDFAADGAELVLVIDGLVDVDGNEVNGEVRVDQTGTVANDENADLTPATLDSVVASDVAGSDELTVTFSEAVQGVGTFLLQNDAGETVAVFTVSEGENTDTLILVTADDVDFAALGENFTLQVIDELDQAGNETDAEAPVEQDATLAGDDNPLVITDAVVATDLADSPEATNTATEGDVLVLTFDETVATSTGASFTVTDADGGETVIECVEDGTPFDALVGTTAATCELSEDGLTLEITLLEDTALGFPVTITVVDGLVDADGNGVDLENSDTEIDTNDATVTVVSEPDPIGGLLP